jgi:hypothetical protein
MLMHAVTGPDRESLRPICDSLNQAVTTAVCSWIVHGTTLDELCEVVYVLHREIHEIICARHREILILAGMAEAGLRAAGNHEAADFISARVKSVARAIVREPSATDTEA